MNFFNQINELLQEGIPLKVVIGKNKDRIVVSVIPDSEDPDLVPATISGNPDEVDSAFFAALTGAIKEGGIHANQKAVKSSPAAKKDEVKKEEEKKEPDLFDKNKQEKPVTVAEAEKQTPVELEPKKQSEPPAEDVKPVAKGFRAPKAEADIKQEGKPKEEQVPWVAPEGAKEPEEKQNDVEPGSSEDSNQNSEFDDDDDWS